MADSVTTRNIFDGGRKLVHSYVNISDGSGHSAVMIDVGTLTTNAEGKTCNRVILKKLWFNNGLAAAASPVQLQWNVGGGANETFLTLGQGSDSYDFTSAGGIDNSEASNVSGDIFIVVPSNIVNGESVTIISEWVKRYV